jgi:long-chain acyl-CoA synthetase
MTTNPGRQMMSGNLAHILNAAADAHGDRPALVCDSRETSFAELARRAAGIAELLTSRGLRAGDRVGILLPNGPDFLAAYHGALRAGAVVVPLNTLLAPPEIAARLAASGTRLTIAAGPLAGAAAGNPVVSPAEAGGADRGGPMAERDGTDPALILYTSGTTGAAKGAILTHAGLRAAAAGAAAVLAYGPGDVILGAAPFSHVLGQSAGMNAALLAGARLAVPTRFDAPRTLIEMAQTGTTVLLGVPTMCIALIAAAGESDTRPPLRLAHIGGAPLPEGVRIAFEAAFGCPIHEGYGLTELSGMATAQPAGAPRTPGSVGIPVPGVEMRLVADDGSECGPGRVGEIQFRGGGAIPGYWEDPAATAAQIDSAGWLSTGDLGRTDDAGQLFLVDRRKEVIIRGGYNVYPREVEEALHQHPDVREAAVVGVPHPTLGEEVAAVVVLAPGATADADALRAFAAERVAAYKYPRRIVFVAELPKSPTGKILKRAIDRSLFSRLDD